MAIRVLAIFALSLIAKGTSTCPETEYLVSGSRPIPDEYLTASSEVSHFERERTLYIDYSPGRSRLDSKFIWVNGTVKIGSWSAKTIDAQQWIQARFLERSYITGIVTQGRNVGPENAYYQRVTSYQFHLSEDCSNFVTITAPNGTNKIFPGNTDQESRVTNMIPSPVCALCVRIQPVTWVSWISLRFDVLGCSCENRFGSKCEQICPTNCASVKNSTWCDDQGFCVEGCFGGFFGRECNNPCPSNCASGVNGSRCDQQGVCVNGCANDHFGRQCSNPCPTNCAPVANGSRCDHNGGCVNGCGNDHFGRQCSNKCPANCSPGEYGSRCDQQGVCVKGCANDHFGTQCSNPCPTNCAQGENGKKCDEQGVCVNGCANDHFGRHCSNPCPTNCAPVAVGSRCLDPGTCAMGYIAGYTGDQSESSTNRIVSEQSGSGYKYGMIASLIVVVVAIVTIAVMIFLLRKTILTSKDVFNRSMSDRSGPSELNQYSMGTCSVYSTLDKQRNEDEPYASITVGLS